MKSAYLALVCSAATAAAAELYGHNHAHHHVRAAVTETVQGPTATVYVLNGHDIPLDQVEAGLKDGKYVLIPPSTPTSTPVPTSTVAAPVFFQETTTPSPPPPPPATSKAPAASPASVPASINANFPSGSLSCAELPTEYGAVPLDYLGLQGWAGVQQVPNFEFGIDQVISYIATAIAGDSCTPNSFCSYACPPGWQKSQWPLAQGNTGQSIGGLFCNSDGMLELSNPSSPQICIPGVGGVEVENSLSQNVCICRTDYPGTESETIPMDTLPGETSPLTCPDATTYYKWEGSDTSAQYYINPAGVPCSKACQWGSAGGNIGNWAPVNAGVGKGTDGVTYISLFPNAPTNPDGELNFNIKINGGSGACSYVGGSYYSNGVESPHGCTVSVGEEGATFEFYD